ncbi:MAG: PEGA domain-containing protein [Myxococcota bacterium]|nr:PEGA domain-containing protein [Myxococcota bacterium]
MKYLVPIILMVSLAHSTPKAPVYWNYPGPHGDKIRAVLAVERTDEHAHHLILPDELDAYLSDIPIPAHFDCLDDSEVCESETQGVLRLLGFGARVDADSRRTDQGYEVTLRMTLADGVDNKVFKGNGETIEEASVSAFAALIGQGTLLLDVNPKTASFRIDGRPYGQGSGRYLISAGKHTLTIEAENHQPTEEPIEIKPSETLKIVAKLAAAFGRLSLKTTPERTTVFLDGNEWANPAELKDVEPGQHIIRVEAPGYEAFSQNVTIRAGVEHALKLKLVPSEPIWRTAMKTTHKDTYANHWYVGLQLHTVSARGGGINLKTTQNFEMKTLSESVGMLGLGLTAGWRSKHLEILGLGLSFQNGINEAKVIMDDETPGRLDTLDRTMMRVGWMGLRYPLWRVDAYTLAGLGLAFETFEGGAINRNFRATTTRLFIGSEFGLRYSFSESWFAGSSIILDYWPDDRPSITWTMNGEYAFDLNGLF